MLGRHIFEDDIFGTMVNYTKRVESSVESPIGIRLSGEAKTHIENERAERHSWLAYQPVEINFKGFPQPQTVWLVYTLKDSIPVAVQALLDSWRRT